MATLKEAKVNLFNHSTIRYVGYIVAFVGVMLLTIGQVTSTFIQLFSIALVLTGILLMSENIKKLYIFTLKIKGNFCSWSTFTL